MIAGGDEDIGVAGERDGSTPSASAALSSVRRLGGAHRRDASAARHERHSAAPRSAHPAARSPHACGAGWYPRRSPAERCPSPTCRVTASRVTPFALSAANSSGVKCRPGGGRGDRAALTRKDGLVVRHVPRIGLALAGDIGRQRHLALLRRWPHPAPRPTSAKRSSASPLSPRLTTCALSSPKTSASPAASLRAGPRQHRIAVGREAAMQKNFDSRPGRSRASAAPCSRAGNHLGVIDQQRIAGLADTPAGRAHARCSSRPSGHHHQHAARYRAGSPGAARCAPPAARNQTGSHPWRGPITGPCSRDSSAQRV